MALNKSHSEYPARSGFTWLWLCLAPCRSHLLALASLNKTQPVDQLWTNGGMRAGLRGDMRQLLLQQAQKKNCATERPYALPTCRGLLSWLTGQIEPQAPAWSVVGNATVVRCNFSL